MTPPATPNPYKRHRFPGEIISHRSGSTTASASPTDMLRNYCLNGVLSCPTRPSANGVASSVRTTPTNSVAAGLDPVTNGIWTRFS
jgi:hypothetical protein